MDNVSLETLEFAELCTILAQYGQTPRGREALQNLPLSTDLRQIQEQLALVQECVQYQRETSIRIGEIIDPRPVLQRLAIIGTALDTAELLDLQRIINVGTSLRQQLREAAEKFPLLAALGDQLPNLQALVSQMRRLLLPSGEINEDASPELRRLRREINVLRQRIYRHLEALLAQAGQEGAAREEFVTVRNNRFVIPVNNDFRGRVPGVVHGMSSSGATAFIEPLSSIEDNNEMVRLKEQEELEINRILVQLADQLRRELPQLQLLQELLTDLDIVVAKANFAQAYDCVKPEMNTTGELHLTTARHPLLMANFRGSDQTVVPFSLQLDRQTTTLVISGPNAGGKTVVLKAVGLLCLMAQAGLPVPAQRARLPILQTILADIGDHQSLAANLSTFSSHIRNISQMTTSLVTPALILLDEVGTGTDPEEGAALAVAIVEYFRQRGAQIIVSTHYNQLKAYAQRTAGVSNAAVEFNERTLQPTYRLLPDLAGTSSGIEIARRLGLSEAILTLATTTLSQRDQAQADFLRQIQEEAQQWKDLNSALESERQATAEKFQQLESSFQQREQQREREFTRQLQQLMNLLEEEAQTVLDKIKDKALLAKVVKEKEKQLSNFRSQARELIKPSPAAVNTRNLVASLDPPPQRVFKVGDAVITELGQTGRVEDVQGNDVFVRVGSLRFKAMAANLQPTAKPQSSAKPGKNVNLVRADNAVIANTVELNVIGQTTAEACERVDKFLDQAFLENSDRLRIIHGLGTGKLKQAITRMLQHHPHVGKFYPATGAEGGGGATIVELKD
jgi:DNA mismatch repair protein MutS2